MPKKAGARLMRLLYSHFYGGSMEKGTCCRRSRETETALALKRTLVEEHRAWNKEGLYTVRLRMIATVPCNVMTADLWK
jgi:hypothetical protein